MKKLISLLITLVMVLSMSVTVFAADTVTIYFDKTDTGWATVSAYYYSDDNFSMTAWPGDIMTQVEDNIFSMEVPTAATTIVFNNNGGGSQTGDITIPTDGKNLYTYNTGTWSVYGGGSSGQDTEITVNGTYVPGGTRAERIAVDVVWDAMDFTYSAPSEGTWNPATHAYEGQTSGGWSDNTPAITVTNHSNVAVNATLGFTADVTGVIGTFTEASGTENDNVLELATAEGTEVANAPTAIANFGISGAAIDATQTLGTITVTIAKNVIDTYEKLQAAVNAGGTVKLGGNITLGDENLVVSSSVPVILDLNGYTLTSNNYTKIVVDPDVICTIKNGTVTNTVNMWSAVYNYGTLTVQNCTLNANNYCSLYNYCTATVTDSTLNGDYYGESICNGHAYSDTVTLTLSGTVNMSGRIYNGYAASVVTVLPGIYNFDPTSYVDAGAYTVTDNGNGTWTVAAK